MSEKYPPPPSPEDGQSAQGPGAGWGQTPPPPGGAWPQQFQPQQPYYPQQQPYYPQQQPYYPQQPPAGYLGYPGGAPVQPGYVRTNFGEYWKNAKNGKRNLSILAATVIVLFTCSCVSASLSAGGSTSASSDAQSNTNQTSNSSNNQSSGQTVTNTQPTHTPTPRPTALPTESPTQYKASAKSVTVSDMSKDPSSNKGKDVTFTAVIVNFVQDSSGKTGGANVADPNDYSSFVQILFTPSFSLANVNKGDTIVVWGRGLGAFNGTNAYGGPVTEAGIQEVYLDDSTSGYSDTSITNPASYVASH